MQDVGHSGKLVQMHFELAQGDIEYRFSLDFDAERIVFDLFSDISVSDTGTAESAERVHEVRRFWQDYFGNGQLHIVNTDTEELIGRKDAFIPMNMYLDDKGATAELAYWKALRSSGASAAENTRRNGAQLARLRPEGDTRRSGLIAIDQGLRTMAPRCPFAGKVEHPVCQLRKYLM